MTYLKTDKQKELDKLLASPAFEILGYGGSRSGKTFHFIRAEFIRALRVERSDHFIARRYFTDAYSTLWLGTIPKVIKLCFPELIGTYKPNNSKFFHPLPNKSNIFLIGLDDKERAEKILGGEFSTGFFNEVSQISLDSINIAKTRLAQKNELKKKLYYDMNPPTKKHWSYKNFILGIDPETGQKLDSNDYASILMNPKDNLDNIDENYFKILDNLPASKRARFRDGLFTDDVVGDVFNMKWIKRGELPADIDRIVIGHDPAVTSKITSDEHGIIIGARKGNFGYIIRDSSGIFSPKVAAQKSVSLYREYECDRIVSEVNNGGDYIETILRSIDNEISFKAVRATRGKVKRAEPVASLYEQGRIFHVGEFPELEAEMGDFKTNEDDMEYSPNRCDALVWLFTELFNLYGGEPRVRNL